MSSLLAALKVYWRQVLTPQGRCLAVLQLALLSLRLLLPGLPLPGWFVELPANAFQPSSSGIEAILLLAFLVQWCAWSELLYGLRLTCQPAETISGSPWRRFALHIYGGFVFLLVLSGLANLQPLLGIGAMFLLFISGEAQEKKLAGKKIPIALLQGMGRSYRLISNEPWRFLSSLLLPGIVLHAGGVLVVWMRLVSAPWILTGTLLVLWLGLFQLAQLQIALRAEGELDVDVLMGEESETTPHPSSASLGPLKGLLQPFHSLCNGLATVIGLGTGSWLLLNLGESGLLSTHALGMAFSAAVSLLSGTVSAFLSLLVKLGFLIVVSAVIAILLMLIIGLGRREPLKPLQTVADRLQQGLERLAGVFSDLSLAKGATLGLGTLLTALGTVAVQTYDRVQKDQERQNLVQETLRQEQRKEEEADQARLSRNDALVQRIQERVGEFRREENTIVRMQLLDLLLSDLRDVLPELRTAKGAIDGERKGKLLRYLYESGLLDANTTQACRGALSWSQSRMPTKEVKTQLSQAGCNTALFLHSLDFSGASLEGAYLNKAFLPFLNLKYADLRGATLRDTTLRFANLENADLQGADLTGADLRATTLVGANLTDAWADGRPPAIEGAVAFYAVSQPPSQEAKGVISWDLVKGQQPGQRDPGRIARPYWTFCPLDPQSTLPKRTEPAGRIAQGGSKCRNRRFDTQSQNTLPSLFIDRDWSGSSFQRTTLKGITLRGITLAGADLSGTTFEDMTLQDVSFAGANLEDAVFKDSSLDQVDFTGADLRGLRIERGRRLHNNVYQGSVIDLDENKSFAPHTTKLLRQQVYDQQFFAAQGSEDVSSFRRKVLAPLLMAPLPLRPQQLLYWMLATPLPGTVRSEAGPQ